MDRPGRPLCGAELFIDGPFLKHNNNVGAVVNNGESVQAEVDRETAQAFSHFTYENSSQRILICDIQGVDGQYTDPQVHTLDGKEFGNGNLGQTGIRAFLLRHPCNRICRALDLPKIHPESLKGTTTSTPLSMAAASNSSRRPSGMGKKLPEKTLSGSRSWAALPARSNHGESSTAPTHFSPQPRSNNTHQTDKNKLPPRKQLNSFSPHAANQRRNVNGDGPSLHEEKRESKYPGTRSDPTQKRNGPTAIHKKGHIKSASTNYPSSSRQSRIQPVIKKANKHKLGGNHQQRQIDIEAAERAVDDLLGMDESDESLMASILAEH